MVRRIHHVGVVVRRLDQAYRFYRDALGLALLREATLVAHGVRAALLDAGETELELLEPLEAGSGVGRFLARRGEGLHHFCFETPDVDNDLRDLRARGVETIDAVAREGLAGRVAFLHPRSCGGVLVELATPPAEARPHTSSLDLKRLVIGARDPKQTVDAFQTLFHLHEVAMNGGPRTMLGVGQGALLVVPAAEVGGSEGLVALSFVADDFDTLTRSLDRARVRFLRGTGEVTIDPASSHGVHMHVSRYRFP